MLRCGNTAVWSWRPQTLLLYIFVYGDECKAKSTKKVNTRDEFVVRILNSANAKTTSGELQVLLSRQLKSALKSMVEFFNTYFELFQFIEIIYINNKLNQ
jgi:hypothetical protein